MAGQRKNQRTAARTRKMRERSYRFIRAFLFVILLFVAFVIGFFSRGQSEFLDSLGFSESVTGVDKTATIEANASKNDVYNSISARVGEVEEILKSDSLDEFSVDTVTDDVLGAFAEATEDPYVRYYSEARYATLNAQSEGYAGVGVLFSEKDGVAYAVDVFESSPAQLAGVMEGDFVTSINGDDSQTWSRSEVASVLSQMSGQSVVIGWKHPPSEEGKEGEEFTTTLMCAEYQTKNVTRSYDKKKHVGYIKVKQLTQNSATLTATAIQKLKERGAQAYVLDLRDNPGGYLNQAVDLASLFMRSGTVVQVRTKDGVSAKASSGQPVTDSPLVIIANGDTAAAAEVVVAALKESQRANDVVGTKTLGKGSVQTIHDLSFGGALRYTAAYYLTPEGRAIDKVGVTPTVQLEEKENANRLKQYAIDRAASYVSAE